VYNGIEGGGFMSQNAGKKGSNRLISAFVMVVLAAVVIYGINSLTTGSNPEEPTAPIAIAPIDSSSCVACHTDAGIIENMAELVDDGGHGGEGG